MKPTVGSNLTNNEPVFLHYREEERKRNKKKWKLVLISYLTKYFVVIKLDYLSLPW